MLFGIVESLQSDDVSMCLVLFFLYPLMLTKSRERPSKFHCQLRKLKLSTATLSSG